MIRSSNKRGGITDSACCRSVSAAHFLAPLVAHPGLSCVLRNERTGETLAAALEAFFDSASRRRGLLGRNQLAPGCAAILAPCNSVHTFFMRFPIDVLFVRRDGFVTKVCPDLKPWRAAVALRAFAAIELAAGATRTAGTRPGDRLHLAIRSESAPSQTKIFV